MLYNITLYITAPTPSNGTYSLLLPIFKFENHGSPWNSVVSMARKSCSMLTCTTTLQAICLRFWEAWQYDTACKYLPPHGQHVSFHAFYRLSLMRTHSSRQILCLPNIHFWIHRVGEHVHNIFFLITSLSVFSLGSQADASSLSSASRFPGKERDALSWPISKFSSSGAVKSLQAGLPSNTKLENCPSGRPCPGSMPKPYPFWASDSPLW